MTCPDLERIIELYQGREDPAVESHIRSCGDCQEILQALFILSPVWAAEAHPPPSLVDRILEDLPRDTPVSSARAGLGHRLVTGLLGALTAAVWILASGSTTPINPPLVVGFSVLGGILAVGLPKTPRFAQGEAGGTG